MPYKRGAPNGHFSTDSPKMTESPSESLSDSPFNRNIDDKKNDIVPEIPIEIVSEEEMALLEAALVSARASFSAIPAIRCSTFSFGSNARSIKSITALSKRRLSGCSEPDIEDSGGLKSAQKKTRMADSFLHRFRKKGLSVTDITATVQNFLASRLFFWSLCKMGLDLCL